MPTLTLHRAPCIVYIEVDICHWCKYHIYLAIPKYRYFLRGMSCSRNTAQGGRIMRPLRHSVTLVSPPPTLQIINTLEKPMDTVATVGQKLGGHGHRLWTLNSRPRTQNASSTAASYHFVSHGRWPRKTAKLLRPPSAGFSVSVWILLYINIFCNLMKIIQRRITLLISWVIFYVIIVKLYN